MRIHLKTEEIIEAISNQDEMTITQISKKTNTTYSHTNRIIQSMEKKNLLKSYKQGRCRHVMILPKGLKLALNLQKREEILEDKQ